MSSIIAVLQPSSGLTLAEVIADIPHDPAAIAVYIMLAASIALIVRSGRARKPGA